MRNALSLSQVRFVWKLPDKRLSFSSMQRIKASLMAKAESELENLQVELKHVQESKPDDDTKHDATVIKLEGKIANLERIVKDLRLSSRLPRRS